MLLLACVLSWGFTSATVYAATNDGTQFEKTNVLDDLRSSDGFNIVNYPFDSTGVIKHPEIMNVVEYCYSFRPNMRGNYGLYLYFYNPQGLNIDTNSRANKVQMAVEYGKDADGYTIPTEYDKFDLQFCSVSTEPNYYRLFYKFKVVDRKGADGKTIAERVNSNERRYDISGIELLTSGDRNATEYTVGGTYTFTGYAQGYGADTNAESNLTCEVRNLETIRLDLSGADDGIDKRTYWRSNSSSLGVGHQNQINSVFFAIDKTVLEKYGYTLQKIKAEWWEYKTAPLAVSSHLDFVNWWQRHVGNVIDEGYFAYNDDMYPNYNFPFVFVIQTSNGQQIPLQDWDGEPIFPMFYSQGVPVSEYTLSSEVVQSYFETYAESFVKGHLTFNGHDYSADLFANSVDSGRTMGYNLREFDIGNPDDYWDIHSYDDTHSWWDKLWDYGFGSMTTDDTYLDISPIQMVTEQDMSVSDLSNHLYINLDDVNDFRRYYDSVKDDSEVFIFRYAVTDYTAYDSFIHLAGNTGENFRDEILGEDTAVLSGSGIEVRQGTEFFDFDIIEFTFNKDGVYTVIPAVSSPVDHWADFTPGIDPQPSDWWQILLMVLALIFLLVILMPILPYVIQFIVWLVLLPFKAIGALFKGIGKAANKRKRGK